MSNVRLWNEKWDRPFDVAGRIVEPSARRVSLDGNAVEIEPRVMAVLIALSQNPRETVRRQELIDRVWDGAPGADQSLNNAISLLRRALGDLDTDNRLIRTIPKQGYQLCADIEFHHASELSSEEDNASPATLETDGGRTFSRMTNLTVAAFGVIAVLAIAAFVLLTSRQTEPETLIASVETDPLSVAVLPFDNFSTESENAYFADGLAEEILHALSQIDTLKVASRTDSFRYRETDTPLPEIGRQLGVANILEGSVRRDGDQLRITAQLISTATNAHLWSSTYDRPAEDILAVQQDIAVNIANALVVEMSSQQRDLLTAMPTANVEAYEKYLIGKHEARKWTPDANRKAVALLEEAVALDPEFAEARLALGRSYYFAGTHYGWMPPSEAIPKVKAALVYSVSAQNLATRAAALSVYADVLAWSDNDWRGAIAAYERSYELSGTPALGYGLTNSIIGEHDAAIGIFQTLLNGRRDVFNLNDTNSIRNNLAWAYFNARRYEDALTEADIVIAADDTYADAYRVRGRAQLQLEQYADAIQSFSSAAQLMNNAPVARSDLAVAHARAGNKAEAEQILKDLENNENYVAAPLIAQIYANLGNVDAAFQWLDKGVDDSARGVIFLKINPLYDPIRTDPRFSDLLNQLKLSS